jgi:hypothetical protein
VAPETNEAITSGPITIAAASFPQTSGNGVATSSWGPAWEGGYMQWSDGDIATPFSASVIGDYSITSMGSALGRKCS